MDASFLHRMNSEYFGFRKGRLIKLRLIKLA